MEQRKKNPLVVIGVRQCGKSYIIDKFCQENYKNYIKIDLSKDERLIDIYNEYNTYEKRKAVLCTTYDINFDDKDTIVFIDEVQKSTKFIQDLKPLCEDGIKNIIIAGSLLSIAIRDMDESYPVGKTHTEILYPMNFEEFLYAIKKERLIPIIKESFKNNEPFGLHDYLMELYRDYLYIGGMPEMLQNYIDNNCDISKINDKILLDIRNDYSSDINKHVKNDKDKLRVRKIYNHIPSQLMKENPKFTFAKLDKNDRKVDYVSAIDWLTTSNMVIECNQLTLPEYPIKGYIDDNNYKLFLSDIGLLRKIVAASSFDVLMDGDYKYKGVITENYVALELLNQFDEILYWTRKNNGNGNKSEVDFVIQIGSEVIPIEVKSSSNKAQSLRVYNELFHPNLMIKIGNNNFGKKDNIKTIPLYATFLIKECLEEEYIK